MENVEMENQKKTADDDSNVTPVEPATVSEDNQGGDGDNDQNSSATSQEPDNTTSEPDTTDNTDAGNNSVKVIMNEKEFSVSLADKQNAIAALVNDTYVEDYEDWYYVDVYEEEKIVVMHSCATGKHYRQSFAVKKDVYSLKGDRVEVFAQFLTQDEIAKLDSMKENYSVIEEKLGKYESEPDKQAVLAEAKYNYVRKTEEFEALSNEHFDFSVEDVRKKADDILLNYAAEGKLEFSTKETESEDKVTHKSFAVQKKSSSRYGNIFN